LTPEINLKLTEIEIVLINEESPDYLEVSYQQGFIYILCSKAEYMYSSLSERIYSIFEILETFCGDILEEYSFIVETFTAEELSGLFRSYGK
jgi:hypothetical protein